MRITILAVGSRGDVQPFVALGIALKDAGHQVRIAAAADYAALVTSHGLEFALLVGQIQSMIDPEMVYQFLDAVHPLRAARLFFATVDQVVDQLLADCWAACRDAQALIVTTLGVYCGTPIAEALGIPCYPVHFHPYGPTRAWPSFFAPTLPRWWPGRATYNYLTHMIVEHTFWQLLRRPLNRTRQRLLGMAPRSMGAQLRLPRWEPTLLAYSPLLVPSPPDWTTGTVTGFWSLEPPAHWQPPADILAFLAAGPPPVYFGFGSMFPGRDPAEIIQLLAAALAQTGQRAILFDSWDSFDAALPTTILRTRGVPHCWLLPQVSAVIHHGGAGTTAAALRAGVPSVIVPFVGDQHFWAARVHALGAAPAPLPHHALTSERLVAALREIAATPRMHQQAARIGAALRAERGVAHALALLNLPPASLSREAHHG